MVGGEPIDTGTTNVLFILFFHQPWNVLLFFFFLNEYKNMVAHF